MSRGTMSQRLAIFLQQRLNKAEAEELYAWLKQEDIDEGRKVKTFMLQALLNRGDLEV